jgi:fibronectin type 3 domain-containing protein
MLAASALGQSAPSGVWATAASGAVNLNWNAVPGASYDIYRGTSAGHEGSKPIGNTGSTNFTDSGVTNGTAYYYKITALYGTKQGPGSAEVSCKPGSTLSGATTPVAFSESNAVALYYSAVPSATFYRTLRYNPNLGWQLVGTTTALSFKDTTVQNGVEYMYEVVPGNASTDGTPSFWLTAVPGDAPVGTPALTWTAASSGNNSVSWTPVPGALSYVVYRGTATNGEGTQPFAIVGGTNFQDNTVTNGATYYYKIAAMDYTGTGLTGPETSGMPGYSSLTGGLIVATAGASSVTVSWQPVAGATSYYIVRGDGNYYTNQQVLAKVTGTSYTDKAVVSTGTYVYSSIPSTVDGLGTDPNQASAELGDGSTPAPTGLYISSQAANLQLSWNPVPGAGEYAVYRSSGGTPALYAIAGGNSFTDSAVKAGTVYTYAVSAIDIASESPLSTSATGEVNQTPLPAPVIAAATVSGAKVTVYWSLVTGAASYDVFRAVTGQQYYAIATAVKPGNGSTSGTFTDLTAPEGVVSYYYICAVNATGIGLQGNSVTAGPGDGGPQPPTGTFATASTTSSAADAINLTCNPVPGVGAYNVYRGTKSGGEGVLPYAENVGTYYQDPNVKAGVTYYYTFTSVNQDGQSAFSPECSCTWGATPLPAPVVTAYPAAASIALDWSPVSGATSYDVFRAIGNSSYILYQQNVAGTTLTDTDVASTESISYQVYAVNTKGAGNRSNTVTARTGSSAPGITDGIWAISTGTGTTITWNAVAGNNVTYNIFRSTKPGNEGTVPIAVGIGGNQTISYNDATAAAGSVYYYTVTTVTADNQSAQSAEVSVRAQSSQLVAPTLSQTSSTGKVALTWNPISGATSYNIFRTDPILGFILYQQNVSGTSFTDTSVISGVSYVYQVAAVAVIGMGLQSNSVYGNP